jgi:hypothetical protein
MDKQQPQQNPQNPQQNPQKSAAPQNPGSKQRDPQQSQQQSNPQDRYASGTDRARDVPIDRKGGQMKPEEARPGLNEGEGKSGKRQH